MDSSPHIRVPRSHLRKFLSSTGCLPGPAGPIIHDDWKPVPKASLPITVQGALINGDGEQWHIMRHASRPARAPCISRPQSSIALWLARSTAPGLGYGLDWKSGPPAVVSAARG